MMIAVPPIITELTQRAVLGDGRTVVTIRIDISPGDAIVEPTVLARVLEVMIRDLVLRLANKATSSASAS